MKAISLHQPWASLWLTDAKVYETRTRLTHHRGLLLVHATKRVPAVDKKLGEVCIKYFGKNWLATIPLGAIIGMVEIIDCHSTDIVLVNFNSTESICGDWSPGRFAWRRNRNFKLFKNPLPYNGNQGLFNVPDEIANSLK